MTKADLAKALYERWYRWVSRKEARHMVELIFETLKETLSEGETIKIHHFGTFLVHERGERKGRNINTGDEVLIPSRRVVTYKSSVKFKAQVNGE